MTAIRAQKGPETTAEAAWDEQAAPALAGDPSSVLHAHAEAPVDTPADASGSGDVTRKSVTGEPACTEACWPETDRHLIWRLRHDDEVIAGLGIPYRPGASIGLLPDTYHRLLDLAERGERCKCGGR